MAIDRIGLPLKSIEAFEAAARLASFKAAAEELAIAPSAISYRIGQLEELLGVELFVRNHRAIQITPAARELARQFGVGMSEIRGAIDMVEQTSGNRPLTIVAERAFALTWLAPRLERFMRDRSHSQIMLNYLPHMFGFSDEQPDAEIVIGNGTGDPDMCRMEIFEEYAMPVLSPDAFRRLGGRADEDLLARATLLHVASENRSGFATWSAWLEAFGYSTVDPFSGIQMSSADMAIYAARYGCGVALGRFSEICTDVLSGNLVAPFAKVIRLDRKIEFRCRAKALADPELSAFRDWLGVEADEHVRLVRDHLGMCQVELPRTASMAS